MIVLQEQINLLIDVSQIVYQSGYDCARTDQDALTEQVNRWRAHPLTRALQSVAYIEEKGRRLVIVRIDGQPCDGIFALLKLLGPSRGQRGLAEPRGPL